MKDIIGICIAAWYEELKIKSGRYDFQLKWIFSNVYFPNPANLLMQKHHLNIYWTGEKIPFSFPILILHLAVPYHTTPAILPEMWIYDFQNVVKSKFLLWQPHSYDWLKKMITKLTFLKQSFFENALLLSVSKNFLQTPALDDTLLGNFTLPNSIISVKELIRWIRGFEIFLIDPYAGDFENKISLVSIKKSLYQCHPPYTRRASSHRVLYLKFLVHIIYIIFICI